MHHRLTGVSGRFRATSSKLRSRMIERGPFEQKTEQLMEALSDPKRIALLRLLRQRPHFGREVAEQFGVSASTASYHIEKLVTAHHVRLELSSGRRFYYAINPHGFRELLDLLEEQYIGQKKDKETNDIPGNETRKTD